MQQLCTWEVLYDTRRKYSSTDNIIENGYMYEPKTIDNLKEEHKSRLNT